MDMDMDGIPDACDVCAEGDDRVDTESDGTPDACETPGPETNYDLTGGACTASSAPAWHWPLLVLLALLLGLRWRKSPTEPDKPITRQRRKILLASLAALACSTTGALTSAHAQQLSIAQYQPPALASDGLVLAKPSVSGHLASSSWSWSWRTAIVRPAQWPTRSPEPSVRPCANRCRR